MLLTGHVKNKKLTFALRADHACREGSGGGRPRPRVYNITKWRCETVVVGGGPWSPNALVFICT